MLSSVEAPEEKPTEEISLLMSVEKFTYTKINKVTGEDDAITHLSFEAFPNTLSKDFISLYKDRGIHGIERNDGIKFHISVANIEDNIERGWNIVLKHIIKNNIVNCKVIRDHLRSKMMIDKKQVGKEITVYIYKNIEKSVKDWEKIIQEITEDLAKNKIIPGPMAGSDNSIKGCNYISYRGYKASTQQFEFSSDSEETSPGVPKLDNKEDDDQLAEINLVAIEGSRESLLTPAQGNNEISPDTTNNKENDDLLAETNLIRIERARRALFTHDIGVVSESSHSITLSSDSETKSDSTSSPRSGIDLPFRDTEINVPNQPPRMSRDELKILHKAITEIPGKPQDTDKVQVHDLLSRTISVSNFSSFYSSSKSEALKVANVDDKQDASIRNSNN
jgi:hypothetical protein